MVRATTELKSWVLGTGNIWLIGILVSKFGEVDSIWYDVQRTFCLLFSSNWNKWFCLWLCALHSAYIWVTIKLLHKTIRISNVIVNMKCSCIISWISRVVVAGTLVALHWCLAAGQRFILITPRSFTMTGERGNAAWWNVTVAVQSRIYIMRLFISDVLLKWNTYL